MFGIVFFISFHTIKRFVVNVTDYLRTLVNSMVNYMNYLCQKSPQYQIYLEVIYMRFYGSAGKDLTNSQMPSTSIRIY